MVLLKMSSSSWSKEYLEEECSEESGVWWSCQGQGFCGGQ